MSTQIPVAADGTPTQNGTALLAAYATAVATSKTSVNRAVLVLASGTYLLTSVLSLATNYIDFTSASGNPDDVTIQRATGGPLLAQAANDMRFQNVTVRHLGMTKGTMAVTEGSGDHTFIIAASIDNSASQYTNCRFRHPGDTTGGRLDTDFRDVGLDGTAGAHYCFTVASLSNIAGTWTRCQFDPAALRLWTSKSLTATVTDCIFSDWSIGSDATGSNVAGTFLRCTIGNLCVGSCTGIGSNVSGSFTDCTFGNQCIAVSKTFSGTMIRCTCGTGCVAGMAGGYVNNATFKQCVFYGQNASTDDITLASLANMGNGADNSTFIACSILGQVGPAFGTTLQNCLVQTTGNLPPIQAMGDGTTVLTGTQLITTATTSIIDGLGSEITANGIANKAVAGSVTNDGTLTVNAGYTTRHLGYGANSPITHFTAKFTPGSGNTTIDFSWDDVAGIPGFDIAHHYINGVDLGGGDSGWNTGESGVTPDTPAASYACYATANDVAGNVLAISPTWTLALIAHLNLGLSLSL